MKTIVYQSYRTVDVPEWITRCMETVKSWAELKGFDYEFIDDRLFEYVPDWYLEIACGQIELIADLARLEIARKFLQKGYDRTIWVDADVVIFNPEKFTIKSSIPYAFCREVWIGVAKDGKVLCSTKVNNAVTVFTKDNTILDIYINTCKDIVKLKGDSIDKLDISTRFLTNIYEQWPDLPLLTNVGLFSPAVIYSIVSGSDEYIELYINKFGYPVQAANLCASHRNYNLAPGIIIDDNMFLKAVDKLIVTKGSVVNNKLRRGEMKSWKSDLILPLSGK